MREREAEIYRPRKYHALENTANQNTGKPLIILWYYVQPFNHAQRVGVSVALIVLVTVYYMAW